MAARAFASIATFTVTAALAAGGYLAVARTVDPYGDFTTGRRRFPLLIWDSRPRKLELFQAYAVAGRVDGILLGSSRTQKLNPQDFARATGGRFFNFAVGSMMAEEYLATYRWVRHQGVHPRIVIIGIDVEGLSNEDAPVPGFRRMAALNALLLQDHGWLSFDLLARVIRVHHQAFTIPYAKAMGRTLWLAWGPRRQPKEVDYAPDGYTLDPQREEALARGAYDFRRNLDQCFAEYFDRFRAMTHLSAKRQRYLEQVIREAQQDGATVSVWITPIHPVTVEHVSSNTEYGRMLDATREYLGRLGRTTGMRVHDFSSPERFGGDTVDWIDCGHISAVNASRIAARLIADVPR